MKVKKYIRSSSRIDVPPFEKGGGQGGFPAAAEEIPLNSPYDHIIL